MVACLKNVTTEHVCKVFSTSEIHQRVDFYKVYDKIDYFPDPFILYSSDFDQENYIKTILDNLVQKGL